VSGLCGPTARPSRSASDSAGGTKPCRASRSRGAYWGAAATLGGRTRLGTESLVAQDLVRPAPIQRGPARHADLLALRDTPPSWRVPAGAGPRLMVARDTATRRVRYPGDGGLLARLGRRRPRPCALPRAGPAPTPPGCQVPPVRRRDTRTLPRAISSLDPSYPMRRAVQQPRTARAGPHSACGLARTSGWISSDGRLDTRTIGRRWQNMAKGGPELLQDAVASGTRFLTAVSLLGAAS